MDHLSKINLRSLTQKILHNIDRNGKYRNSSSGYPSIEETKEQENKRRFVERQYNSLLYEQLRGQINAGPQFDKNYQLPLRSKLNWTEVLAPTESRKVVDPNNSIWW